MPLHELVRGFNLAPGPVLHVGAHLGEEAPAYSHAGFLPVWWIEANGELIERLRRRVEPYIGQHVVQAVCADTARQVTFHLASNGESSSIFPLGTHAEEHPEVTYVGERVIQATTVDILYAEGKIGAASFMNVDVQGAELEVLIGAEGYLEHVDAIYLEINERELYEGCALLPEVEEWLGERGFRLAAKKMTPHFWGDGLFLR